ncbi:hypothetical protein DRP04_10810, partial [Archaeoglobales archaeon]
SYARVTDDRMRSDTEKVDEAGSSLRKQGVVHCFEVIEKKSKQEIIKVLQSLVFNAGCADRRQ